MKKEDLKTGDLVKTKDFIGIIFTDEGIVVDILRGDYLILSEFNDYLEYTVYSAECYDILAVYKPCYIGDSIRAICRYVERREEPNWSWQKEYKYILDKEERRYLRNIIRPFKSKVENIKKRSITTLEGKKAEFIRINLIENEFIDLPFFEEGKYYKNMKRNKNYTIQDLKLFD